jgi:molybdopterin synthase catalytic subunit
MMSELETSELEGGAPLSALEGRVALSYTPLIASEVEQLALRDAHGGVLTFTGRVRDHNEGEGVSGITYEAYDSMALKELVAIVEEASERFPKALTVVHHRLGVLAVGDIAVVVSVSAPHRAVTFEACAWVIDTLKARVPIFKHERRADGRVWVGLGP